jgi:putative oxidoreductase
MATEFFGGLALIAGFLSRVAALAVAIDMAGAVAVAHWKVGFFMNWGGQQAGEGFEFHILAIAMSLAILVRGSGAASVDGLLAARDPSPSEG